MASIAPSQQHSFWREVLIAVIAAVLGAVVGLAPTILRWVNPPPPDSTVISLMNQDVQAALHHDGNLVSQIYSLDGVVMDAGCQSPGSGVVFSGLDKIQQRYNSLPPFASLAHVNIHVTWIPDDKSATQATATAETVGALEAAGGGTTPISGHEQWTFALIDGHWLITSFTYNLYLPSSP